MSREHDHGDVAQRSTGKETITKIGRHKAGSQIGDRSAENQRRYDIQGTIE
jgi:hypothetical protein